MTESEREEAMDALDALNAEIEELEEEIRALSCHHFATDATEEDEDEIENEISYLETFLYEAYSKRKALLERFPEIRYAGQATTNPAPRP